MYGSLWKKRTKIAATERTLGAAAVLDEGLLLREAHHRMMNTLAIVAGGLRRDLAGLDGPAREVVGRYERWVRAQAEVHRCFTLSQAGDAPIDAEAYFTRLCNGLAEAVLEPRGLECVTRLVPGLLPPKHCERLGMIVTELVINATKHAFPSMPRGRVSIDLEQDDGVWRCIVADDGVGFVEPAAGAGGRIVAALATSLGAMMVTTSGPTGTTVSLYLDAWTREPSEPALSVRRLDN